MYKIGENSLWYDECFSIDLGNDSSEEIIHYSLYNDTNPPLYILLLHFWMKVFGDSELALRSVSAICSSLACGVFFLLTLRFFNWQTAVFSMLLYFTSNEIYFYSEEGRTYGLILFLCITSNYIFLCLLEKPNWIEAILLGLFNITIFYSHTLACINLIGQLLLALILGFNKELLFSKIKHTSAFLGYKLSFIKWYSVSWLVFVIIFWPWEERFFGIIKDGVGGFWLQKPTIKEYKEVLYDFFNSETLFYAYLIIVLIVLTSVIVFKKIRDTSFNYKLILIPIILGPFLFHVNFFSANLAPIFLKRYVLFTLPFFLILFAYSLSTIKLNFKIKFCFVLIFTICLAYNMQVPRPRYWDYKNGIILFENLISPTTYISTDNSALFSYYFDRKGAFKAYQKEREEILARNNVFAIHGTTWPDSLIGSHYKNIYYTRSFEDYEDPARITRAKLKANFVWVEDLEIDGIRISHYLNLNAKKKDFKLTK